MSKTTGTLTISEKAFSRQVEDLLKTFHWRWCHFRPARTEHGWRTALSGHQGFPDYIATKGSRLLICELKSGKNKLSPSQVEWIDSLKQIPSTEVYVWYPENWDDIVSILR